MKTFLLALAITAATPAAALAWGGIGCTDLPDHERAIGALEGMTGACDMSVEQARRILALDGQGAAADIARPDPARHPRHARHRRGADQQER